MQRNCVVALHLWLFQFQLEDYVHDYYSLERFKATYQFVVNPMVDKSEWRVANPGFEMLPPKLERSAGRPRVKRIKSRGEPGKRGPYQCKRCFQFGHTEKGCREPLLNLVLNYHLHFLPNLGRGKERLVLQHPRRLPKRPPKSPKRLVHQAPVLP